jgi:hypothetical protein
MRLWNWIFGADTHPVATDINPATGLPMLGDVGGVDVAGNPYGLDLGCHTFDSLCDVLPSFDAGFDPGAGLGHDWSD